jgi:hypothetical protein
LVLIKRERGRLPEAEGPAGSVLREWRRGLLVYRAELLLQFCDEIPYPLDGPRVCDNLPLQLAVTQYLHFEFHALAFMSHSNHQNSPSYLYDYDAREMFNSRMRQLVQ